MLNRVGDELTGRMQYGELVEHGDLQRPQPPRRAGRAQPAPLPGCGPAKCGTAEARRPVRREQRDVVVVARALDQHLQGSLAHAGRPPLGRSGVLHAADRGPGGGPGDVDGALRRWDPRSLGQSVGEEQDDVVGAERVVAGAVVLLGRERSGPAHLQEPARAVRRDDQRGGVPGRAVLDRTGRRIDHQRRTPSPRGTRGGRARSRSSDRQCLRDRVVGEQPLVEHGAQLAHHRRRA